MSMIKEANGTQVLDPDGPVEKTDMSKVQYYLQRPGLLLSQVPESQREALQAHVGRRVVPRGLANNRLNKR